MAWASTRGNPLVASVTLRQPAAQGSGEATQLWRRPREERPSLPSRYGCRSAVVSGRALCWDLQAAARVPGAVPSYGHAGGGNKWIRRVGGQLRRSTATSNPP